MSLEDYLGDMEMCCRCSTCKFIPMQKIEGVEYANVCPSIARYNFHSYSAGGRLNIATSMLKNGFKYSDKLLDIVYNCQMCGACGVSCNYAMDMEIIEPISEFRAKCVADGRTNPLLETVISRLRNTGTMVPVDSQNQNWTTNLNIKDVVKDQVDVLYHPGCLTNHDNSISKLAVLTVKLLQQAGVNFGISRQTDLCCGGRTYQMGYQADFLEQAKKNMAMIKEAGVKTIITGCADCYQAFKVLYDKYHLKGALEVLHTTEYFARLIKEGKLRLSNKVDIAVTYHDPCRLGRLGEPWVHWQGNKIPGHRFIFDPPKVYRKGTFGVYEPPREILRNIGVQLKEMVRVKEYAWCCGAGGGVIDSNPDFAKWTSLERIKEAAATGVEAIATACPWCEKTFNDSIAQSGDRMKVYDIVELLAQAVL